MNKYVCVVAESINSRSLVREVTAINLDQAIKKVIKAGLVIRRGPMLEKEWNAKHEPVFVEYK